MTRRTITGVLAAAVAFTANFAVAYPAGTSRGDYLGAYTSSLVIGQTEYKVPAQATIAYGAAGVTITNNTNTTWPLGAAFYLSLDVMGASNGWPSSDGKVLMPRVQDWPTVFLNLGSPLAINPAGLRVAAALAAAGPVALSQNFLDVPRNITIASSGNDAGITFTIKSNDVNGNLMVETMAGAGVGTVTGKKAHYTNIQISSSGAAAGTVGVGWGNQLGLPCFVPSAVFVQKEFQDLVVAGAGAFTYGDQAPATGITGDVRGTYLPAVAPDGTKAYGILCCLPEPGYGGQPQFAG